MPLQKLKFRPGVVREQTTLTGEGGWFECDKIRFRSGMPEKLAGWMRDTGPAASALKPPSGSFWGVARSIWNWVTLAQRNLVGVGTSLKYYIQDSINGGFNDVTPIRFTTTTGGITFAATNGSPTLTVTCPAGHNASVGDFVTFSGATSLGGTITAAILNAEHRIVTVTSATVFTVTASVNANASDTGNGGASTVGSFQLSVGADTFTYLAGWGNGGYGQGTWGVGASIATIPSTLRLWSQANYGQNLIINPRGGGLFMWVPNANPTIYDRAVRLSPSSSGVYQTDVDCPTQCNLVMVSDSSRFVLAFGVNDYGDTTLDPLLVRWSQQENYQVWSPAITNQAGSFRLSHGSAIISALQSRQEILVWTDAAVYSMQYLGPPYVWGFQILADNISIVSPRAAVSANSVTYWMGADKFYMYAGRVDTLPCDLWQYVFNDINLDQAAQIFCGTVERFQEVWWFYCSANSTAIDRYVVYNYGERIWYYGTLARTAWLDTNVRANPMATDYNGQLIYHEAGTDDGSVNPPAPITAYIQSSDFDIGDGHNFGLVHRILPDITFDGSASAAPTVTFTAIPRINAGANYSTSNTPSVTSANNYQTTRNYVVQQFTPIVYVRLRGRQMAFRVSSNALGTQWQLGVPRIDIRPDGRR